MTASVHPPVHRGGIVALAAALTLFAGCSSMSERQRGTAQGAGIGAVAGAVIGSATGGNAGRSAAIGGVVGAVAGNLWSKRMQDRREALERASQGTGVEVARTDDNRLKLNVPSDVSFDSGRADIKPQMRPVLDEIARTLDANVQVTIVGHTDSTGSAQANLALSQARAARVREALLARGVAANRLEAVGMGPNAPVASNDTEDGRARNRRVELVKA